MPANLPILPNGRMLRLVQVHYPNGHIPRLVHHIPSLAEQAVEWSWQRLSLVMAIALIGMLVLAYLLWHVRHNRWLDEKNRQFMERLHGRQTHR